MKPSKEYGTERSALAGVFRFSFSPRTANSNLRRHLYAVHPKEYDEVVSRNGWRYKLSSQWNVGVGVGEGEGEGDAITP